MNKPLNFQQIIMTLQQYWADLGFLVWQPYHESVGAGTANPATILKVLGKEPWNVAYVEPSFRPDDGRFGDNPNRMQMHHQFQVIIQPDPGNPQELYLNSLFAIGLNQAEHDIRFVEDNWESPALGAWGLGWEVWLDGMEISQYTYFQQSGGYELDPVAVELTYGLERIAMYLQDVQRVWDIDWDGKQSYGDILLRQEIEFCEYEFNVADVDSLIQAYNMYEAECKNCLEKGLVIPAHDYVLKCSHTFNILDTRGAIGVTERAGYFGRMRRMSRQVAAAFVNQREAAGYPLLKHMPERTIPQKGNLVQVDNESTLLLEIGSEELPSHDVTATIAHLESAVPKFLADLRLSHGQVQVLGTPRRMAILVESVAVRQTDMEETARGPAVKIAFDAEGNPSKAAIGFARGKGVDVADLQRQTFKGKEHVVAIVKTTGRSSAEVLADELPNLIRAIPFGKSMRWLASAQYGDDVAKTTYSRPLRWIVALLGEQIVPFEYAGVASGRISIGLRPAGSPEMEIHQADNYLATMAEHEVMVDHVERQAYIKNQLDALAGEVGGTVPNEPALLEEVTHLVEQPTTLIGSFGEEYLQLPDPVLITVMKKHQRYFPLISHMSGNLMPYFLAVRNGNTDHLSTVRRGNEQVLRARYADANFFFKADTEQPLADFLPRLNTLTFQEKLGSMLDKSKRLEQLVAQLGQQLQLSADDLTTVTQAAKLSKADLATNMVVELTSLQGIMGAEYAKLAGESESVANAIVEHYYPQASLPQETISRPGLVLNMANRLDSLCGLFAVGKAPSGSADPFALRRDALSLVTILLENQVDFETTTGLELAASLMPAEVASQSLTETAEFIQRRLEGVLREEYNLPHDVVQAVLAERGNNPWLALNAGQALASAVKQENWDDTLTAYARCVRIVRPVEEQFNLKPSLFAEPSEQALHEAYQQVQANLDKDDANLAEVITQIETILVSPINSFFDGVMVMVDDEAIRNNRLALLQAIRDLTKGYADFSRLQGF
ncbi:glycine--tRNA ligase subunit beta [Anaerolineales bacterium HSG24]|nr:glycine--tRNA ligase subunit beta [Anaerolineales bacterium HSG24]